MTRRIWAPLLAVMLIAVIIGPGTVTATEPRVTTRTITIPAAAFQPSSDFKGYLNWGDKLTTNDFGVFVAPLSFEVPVVYVKRISLVAYDNLPFGGDAFLNDIAQTVPLGEICAYLKRATPMSDSNEYMSGVCSNGTGTLVREFTQRAFDVRRITGAYGPYLMLWVGGGAGLSFNAVRVTYTY